MLLLERVDEEFRLAIGDEVVGGAVADEKRRGAGMYLRERRSVFEEPRFFLALDAEISSNDPNIRGETVGAVEDDGRGDGCRAVAGCEGDEGGELTAGRFSGDYDLVGIDVVFARMCAEEADRGLRFLE